MFEMKDGWGERMWVTVTAVKKRKLIGKLDNLPVGIPGLIPGDKIKFRREHIIDIWSAHEGQAEICPGNGTPEHPDPLLTREACNGHNKHHEVAADEQFRLPEPPTSPPASSS